MSTTAKRLAEFNAGSGRYAPAARADRERPASVPQAAALPRVAKPKPPRRRPRCESPIDAIDAIQAAADVILDSPVKEFEQWLRKRPKQALRALADVDDALQALDALKQSISRCV